MTCQDYFKRRKSLYERLKISVETGNVRRIKKIVEQIECLAEEYGRASIIEPMKM